MGMKRSLNPFMNQVYLYGLSLVRYAHKEKDGS